MQDRLLNMLMQEDEITWQSIIYDLVKSEQMNPWDIDISLLTHKYLETIKEMQEHNFFISGKVILASAILLKIKSTKLLTENLADFDAQLFQQNEDLLDDGNYIDPITQQPIPSLLIKTPQARKRRIDLNDLISALDKALKVNQKRMIRRSAERIVYEARLPEKKVDITELIKSVYNKILNWFKKKEKITFTELVGSDKKDDKINTFIPLLYLANGHSVDLNQEIPFGEIEITKYNGDGNAE